MFKNNCLTSVSAVVFLSAFSTINPSVGMDEEKVQNHTTGQNPKTTRNSRSDFAMGIG